MHFLKRSHETPLDAQIVRVKWACRLLIIIGMLSYSWVARFFINPDGIRYLEQGSAWWSGDWHNAINSYWSPGLPWLTGLIDAVFHPAGGHELIAAHAVIFLIAAGTLFSFEFFWNELLLWGERYGRPATAFDWAFGYACFSLLHIFGKQAIIILVTPDTMVAASVYVASGLVLRFAQGRLGVGGAATLGTVLGCGYLAKAVMLPTGLLFLAVLVPMCLRRKSQVRFAAVAVLTFAVVSGAFVVALSRNYHRFTYGDAGNISVAYWENGVSLLHWQGSGTPSMRPLHPTRMLNQHPQVFEFANPISGSYPPASDPSYWLAGADTHMHPARVLMVLKLNGRGYLRFFAVQTGVVTLVLLFLLISGSSFGLTLRNLLALWPILVPTLGVLAIYALVYFEYRYVIAQTLVLWGAIFVSPRFPSARRRNRATWIAGMLVVPLSAFSAIQGLRITHGLEGDSFRQLRIAHALQEQGVRTGESVAIIGSGPYASWAHLDRLKIVAEVPSMLPGEDSAAEFWASPNAIQQSVIDLLRSSGARAVVADPAPRGFCGKWMPLESSGASLLILREDAAGAPDPGSFPIHQ